MPRESSFKVKKGNDAKKIIIVIVSFGMLIQSGSLSGIIPENETTYVDSTFDPFSKYKIPRMLSHEMKCVSLNNEKKFKLKMDLTLSKMIDKIDILSELPFLIRKFIQTFITAPYVYQWTEHVSTNILAVDDGSQSHPSISGNVFQECTFLDELE